MSFLFLSLIIVGLSLQNISCKMFDEKVKNSNFTFLAMVPFFAAFFFIIPSKGNVSFDIETFLYSLGFAATYFMGVFGSLLAIATGPLSLSALIAAYSLIIPACYGLIFLNEPVSVFLIIGIVLLLVSLFLINMEKKGDEKKITLKWGFYALLSFVGNGGCSTVQRMQIIYCEGKNKNEFMIMALLMASLLLFVTALIKERKGFFTNLKRAFPYSLIYGVSNGMVNYLVIVLSATMAASLMFPLISAGGIVLTVLISIFFYKEKLSREQIIGVILGVGAIVALNI